MEGMAEQSDRADGAAHAASGGEKRCGRAGKDGLAIGQAVGSCGSVLIRQHDRQHVLAVVAGAADRL